jgi:hypothetical protein
MPNCSFGHPLCSDCKWPLGSFLLRQTALEQSAQIERRKKEQRDKCEQPTHMIETAPSSRPASERSLVRHTNDRQWSNQWFERAPSARAPPAPIRLNGAGRPSVARPQTACWWGIFAPPYKITIMRPLISFAFSLPCRFFLLVEYSGIIPPARRLSMQPVRHACTAICITFSSRYDARFLWNGKIVKCC